MNTEYQWWLLAVLVAAGAGIFWLLRGSLPRREVDVEAPELAAEARWISRRLHEAGESIPAGAVQAVLEEHRRYLAEPPADAPLELEVMPPPPVPARARRPSATGQSREARARRTERSRRGMEPRPGDRDLPAARYRESSSEG